MNEYKSITTPGFMHSGSFALIEVRMLRQHGALPPYPWRKNSGYQKAWVAAMGVVNKILKSQHLSLGEILFICSKYNVTLSWDKIGLILWHAQNSYIEEADLHQEIDAMMATHANEAPVLKKKIGRKNLLRKRSQE